MKLRYMGLYSGQKSTVPLRLSCAHIKLFKASRQLLPCDFPCVFPDMIRHLVFELLRHLESDIK